MRVDSWFPLSAAVLLAAGIPAAQAAAPMASPEELPRVPPTPPAEALKTFRLKPGFRLELVAAEPLVVDPIALSFDEDGRLFVVEMRDYSERRPERLGRIRRLEDTDGDGRFDRSTVYVDDLPWPTAVFCYGGGVFVGATPDLLFCKDTDGDGRADVREVVFTGFAADYAPFATNQLNVQALLNSLNWGLDNRIHGATSLSGGRVTSPKQPSQPPVELRGRDFAFDPRTFTLVSEPGGGQHGLSFDDTGRRFVSHNSDHVQTFLYDDRYAARNPAFLAPGPRVSIAVDGPAAEVFRISPEEPWRVLRTRWRVAGLVPGPIEGGGRASGYFTSATGVTIYRGDAWPEAFRGDAFVADCGSNLVHRKKLRPDGVSLKAERPADEQRVEFLASTDPWFRPVQMANGPDGALYIADMYREVIEHPWSLPPGLKEFLDLNSGNDRGRIYRIVPEGFRQPKPPRLSRATSAELVALLAHPNGWHRDTAARLLYERQDRSAVPALVALLESSPRPLGRLHALWTLDGLGALTPARLRRALDDADGRVREHAVRLSETFVRDGHLPDDLAAKVLALADDAQPRVRYQVAFTLGEFRHPRRVDALARIIRRDAADPWVRTAVLTSLAEGALELFHELVGRGSMDEGGRQLAHDGDTAKGERPASGFESPAAWSGGSADGVGASDAMTEFLRQLVTVLGAQNQPDAVAEVIDHLAERAKPAAAFELAGALAEGLQRAGGSLARADTGGKLRALSAKALALAQDPHAEEPLRLAAAHWLGGTTFEEAGQALTALLAPGQPPSLQLAAIRALSRFRHDGVAGALLQWWTSYTPRVRDEALATLLARAERAAALLTALEQGAVPRAALTPTQRDFLRNHGDHRVRERAIRFFAESPAGGREAVIERFRPALELAGDAARGKVVYQERCASCHRLAGEGYALGPDLETVRHAGKEKLLVNLLDPNREVAPNYVSYLVETRSEESWSGLIVNETPASLTLRRANGEETVIPRAEAVTIRSQGLSLMPEGLEADLTLQGMADLLEYVMTATPRE